MAHYNNDKDPNITAWEKEQQNNQQAQDDFNELLYDKRNDEVIQPGTPEYKEAFYELYGRYPGQAQEQGKELFTKGEWYSSQYADNKGWGIFVKGKEIAEDLQGMVIGVFGHAGLSWNTKEAQANAELAASAPRLYRENKELKEQLETATHNSKIDKDAALQWHSDLQNLKAENKELRELVKEVAAWCMADSPQGKKALKKCAEYYLQTNKTTQK